ncbi:MAG: porin [Alysiella sp.]|uniref:porin n=1 Tax=Alysiella sp. TaxID=1872483 RepID=UPI0026DC82D5|nr:porin [Alysiella sp.]MDO4433037.1 porin [Alysiella sp.]
MKKTLIALTLAALPVAASADVVLYGQIKGGVEVTKVKGEKGTTTNIVDYGSRIGFKGSEQIGDNLKAIWQLEQRVDIAGTAGRGFGTRDSFVGLRGDFGTVKAGHFQTPVARLNGELDEWEHGDDSKAAGLDTFTRTTAATGRKVALSYTTPEFSGLTAELYVSPSDNNNKNKESAIYGTSVSYKHDAGFFADVAGVYVKNTTTVNGKSKDGYQALVQGGYNKDKLFAGLAYQHTKRVDEDVKSGHEVAATVAYKFDDSLRVKASAAYGFGFKDEDGSKIYGNGKYYQGIVGADYALSKRTIVNGQVGYLNVGSGADKERQGTLSVGLVHKF